MKTLKLIANVAIAALALAAAADAQPGSRTMGTIRAGIDQRVSLFADNVDWWDDFLGDVALDEWTYLEGTDTATANGAIVANQLGGLFRLTSGDASPASSFTANGAQLIGATNWSPTMTDSWPGGNLIFAARLRVNTRVSQVSVNAGLTDKTTLHEPFSISGTTVSSNASDSVCFVYDTAQATDRWYACGVAENTDASHVLTSEAPTADAFQELWIVVDEDGDAVFYIDREAVAAIEGAVGSTASLAPTVTVCSTALASETVDIDYVYVGACRE